MKKFITLMLVLCCAFFVVGCGDNLSETYWEDTSKVLTEYFESEKFQQISNLTFNDNLNILIKSDYGSKYAELENVYKPLFNQTIFCSPKYAKVFLAVPVDNNKELKSKFIKINSNFEEFKKEIDEFLIHKTSYEINVDYTDETTATSSVEIKRLNNFKLDYLQLLKKAYNLSESIYNAYLTGYHNFYDYNNVSVEDITELTIDAERKLALNSANLQIANSAIKVLDIYLTKDYENNFDNYFNVSHDFFDSALKKVYENTTSEENLSNALSKLKTWKGVYDDFVKDSYVFEDVINNLDLNALKKCNYDSAEYAIFTKNPENEGKANFYLNYFKNVQIIYDFSLNLLND